MMASIMSSTRQKPLISIYSMTLDSCTSHNGDQDQGFNIPLSLCFFQTTQKHDIIVGLD